MIAIIPARGGSKSIPRKNIMDIKGYPLIAYTIAACQMSEKINRIIVSTEDIEIASISLKFGAEVPFVRPAIYSKDNSRDLGFLKDFFDNIEADEVALMRPTTPLREPEYIDDAIETYYKNRKNITALRSLNKINETPYKVFKIEKNGLCSGFFEDYKGKKD